MYLFWYEPKVGYIKIQSIIKSINCKDQNTLQNPDIRPKTLRNPRKKQQ